MKTREMSAVCRLCFVLALCLLSAGCNTYRVSVNDRVVFSPDPLYTDYQLADETLQNCVAQHIERSGISHAGGLTDLNCSQAGITSIDGLQAFHALRGIKLSHNRIRSLQALADLKHLSELYVDDNHLRNVAVLNRMEALKMVNLSGNPDLLCNEIPSTLKLADNDLPEHCR